MLESLIDPASLVWTGSALIFCAIAAQNFQKIVNLANQIILDVGLLGMLVGLVGMLQNLSDPTKIIPALQVAVLPFLYALFLKGPLYLLSTNESSDFSKSAGTMYGVIGAIGFVGISGWGMTVVAGINAFLDVASSVVFFGSLIFLAILNEVFGDHNYMRVLRTIPAIGIVFALMGCIMSLDFVNNPEKMGPAMAILILVLVYALWLRILLLLVITDISEITHSEIEQVVSTLVYLIIPLFGVWILVNFIKMN